MLVSVLVAENITFLDSQRDDEKTNLVEFPLHKVRRTEHEVSPPNWDVALAVHVLQAETFEFFEEGDEDSTHAMLLMDCALVTDKGDVVVPSLDINPSKQSVKYYDGSKDDEGTLMTGVSSFRVDIPHRRIEVTYGGSELYNRKFFIDKHGTVVISKVAKADSLRIGETALSADERDELLSRYLPLPDLSASS